MKTVVNVLTFVVGLIAALFLDCLPPPGGKRGKHV